MRYLRSNRYRFWRARSAPHNRRSSGLPGFEVLSVDSVVAPAKTPVSIIDRLQQAIVRDLHRPDVKRKFFDSGIEVVGTSPEESAHAIKSEIAKWSKVIKDAGIKVD